MGLLCVELRRIAFSSMATRINLTDQDIAELVYLDSDAHSLEDADISAQSDSDTDKDTDGLTNTSHSVLAVKTPNPLDL